MIPVLDRTPSPRPAVTAHQFGIRPLRAASNAWQRTAEVAGVVAFGLLIGAGVFPW